MYILDRIVELEIAAVNFLVGSLARSWLGKYILINVFWPLAEPTLTVVYGVLRRVVGPVVRFIPIPLRVIAHSFLLILSEITNVPPLVEPLREFLAVVIIEAIDLRYGKTARQEIELFLRLGQATDGFQNKAVLFGSGKVDDPQNCFFPNALALGPAPATNIFCHETNRDYTRRNFQIAQTALFLSIMSYRSDTEIQKCMERGMLPNVQFYSVHTFGETDICIFVGNMWAAVCFRGTEIETIRDLWTSSLIEDPIPFDAVPGTAASTDADPRRVRKRYYKEMLSACGKGWRKYTVGPRSPIPDKESATLFELMQYLHKKGIKIYASGHSLGGGLATLFGAYLHEHLQVPTAANITFGAPPVSGNDAFTAWFDENVHHWRFVYGNEFAPMAPPMPFTSNVELYHVGTLIDGLALKNTNPQALDFSDSQNYLDELWVKRKLISCFYDHNPVFLLRKLQNEIPPAT